MTDELNTAWQSVRFARESRKANPRGDLRKSLKNQRAVRLQHQAEEEDYGNILQRVDEGISHLRNLARTLRDASYAEGEWDTRFRRKWAEIVKDTGHSISDPDADVEPIYDRLDTLAKNLSGDGKLPDTSWPLYGALITSLRHIVVVVDDVASAREAREPNDA